MTHTITIACPHVMPDGEPCKAPVSAELEWHPGEPGELAHWSVVDFEIQCVAGHDLRPHVIRLAEQADRAAKDYRSEPLTRADFL